MNGKFYYLNYKKYLFYSIILFFISLLFWGLTLFFCIKKPLDSIPQKKDYIKPAIPIRIEMHNWKITDEKYGLADLLIIPLVDADTLIVRINPFKNIHLEKPYVFNFGKCKKNYKLTRKISFSSLTPNSYIQVLIKLNRSKKVKSSSKLFKVPLEGDQNSDSDSKNSHIKKKIKKTEDNIIIMEGEIH
jgi:hypothetical protein